MKQKSLTMTKLKLDDSNVKHVSFLILKICLTLFGCEVKITPEKTKKKIGMGWGVWGGLSNKPWA